MEGLTSRSLLFVRDCRRDVRGANSEEEEAMMDGRIGGAAIVSFPLSLFGLVSFGFFFREKIDVSLSLSAVGMIED